MILALMAIIGAVGLCSDYGQPVTLFCAFGAIVALALSPDS